MTRCSLRTRLVLTFCAVLMPFGLSAVAGPVFLLPGLLAPTEAILAEVTDEMEPVRYLQLFLLTAAIAARDGRSGSGSAELRMRIEEAFASVQAAPSFSPEERALIQSARREWENAVAAHSSGPSGLSDLATRDGLTGLLNRREFLRLLRDELARTRRYGRSFALLLLDVGHFKKINDTWGHAAGDEALRAITGRIAGELRPTDRAARYGGEELSVLLPETNIAGAAALAERVRAAIAATPVAAGRNRVVAGTEAVSAD